MGNNLGDDERICIYQYQVIILLFFAMSALASPTTLAPATLASPTTLA
jgi:hypothetical protein